MHSDDFIIIVSSAILAILIALSFKRSKAFALVNAIVFVAYSIFMIYGLYNLSEGGTALVWWFYLLAITGLHIFIVGIFLFVNRRSN